MTPKKSFFSIAFVDSIIASILHFFGNLLGNYGLAIIATTFIIKIILLPLSIYQEKQQRLSQELTPKLKELEKKYPKKGPEYNKAVAELYQNEKVNPLLGCLPLFIQLPVFVGLFNAIYYGNILGDSKFMWFYLSKPDSLFMIGAFSFNLLPILTTLLQVLQQKVMMSGVEQTKETQSMNSMMMTMPIIMLVIFYKMPSGLNLYYLVNMLLSIIQSYIFMKTRKNKK